MLYTYIPLQNTTSVEAYFPEALWYDIVSGEQMRSSGESVSLDIDKTDIYISVRGGVIIPAQTPARTTTETYEILFCNFFLQNLKM